MKTVAFLALELPIWAFERDFGFVRDSMKTQGEIEG